MKSIKYFTIGTKMHENTIAAHQDGENVNLMSTSYPPDGETRVLNYIGHEFYGYVKVECNENTKIEGKTILNAKLIGVENIDTENIDNNPDYITLH